MTPIVAALRRLVQKVGSNTDESALQTIVDGLVEEMGWSGAAIWVRKDGGRALGWHHGDVAEPGHADAQWPLRVAGRHLGVLVTAGPSSEDQRALTGMLAGRCAHILADARRSAAQRSLLEGLGHELRTPLQSLLGYADLIASGALGELDPRQADAADALTRMAARILAVSHDVLQAARIDAGREELAVTEVELAPILVQEADAARTRAEEKGLDLEVECERGLAVRTDAGKIARILANLVSNAVKYTETGRIVLRAGALPEGAFLEVEDSGIGIPEAQREAVFDEYVRVGGTGAEGTGLGLSIALRLARLLGGSLELDSTERQGTRVRLVIPACRS
jgi:signal transduction histidine kinase